MCLHHKLLFTVFLFFGFTLAIPVDAQEPQRPFRPFKARNTATTELVGVDGTGLLCFVQRGTGLGTVLGSYTFRDEFKLDPSTGFFQGNRTIVAADGSQLLAGFTGQSTSPTQFTVEFWFTGGTRRFLHVQGGGVGRPITSGPFAGTTLDSGRISF